MSVSANLGIIAGPKTLAFFLPSPAPDVKIELDPQTEERSAQLSKTICDQKNIEPKFSDICAYRKNKVSRDINNYSIERFEVSDYNRHLSHYSQELSELRARL